MSRTWLGDAETKPAPEPLTRIQALVNTLEPSGADRLADLDDAVPWLRTHGLLADGDRPTPSQLDQVRRVREALRALLVHNTGGPPPQPTHRSELRAVTDAATARVDLASDGQIELSASGDSVGDRLLELLLVMRDAQRDGTWTRLKACANDECAWAFYDRSRNHGGTWCVMSECGNKLKNRQFRARNRARAGD
ncbi:RNA-binding protein [Mycobacterium sp. GA-1841]|uniref:CGNR zinc finger domain-containing protein n=1 Tax=Mycobacterium sp. GA-1841 TaxID=1834154 RepID=UPI00096FE283|nr:CGNR zinc finger domain-containing protein [Mycobacterium sp. GA-1841]OMC36955.1 RNA-binding protein [Mycobacterium sp. GA-1841]